MASKIAGKITKVNTLVRADLSSDDSDDECKHESCTKKKNQSTKGSKHKNDKNAHFNLNTIKYGERTKCEKSIDKKAEGNYQGYFVPQLTNNYYASQPVDNSEYVYCTYPNQEANRRNALLWNGNHYDNATLPRQNPHQLKYFPDFLINNPNLHEIQHSNTIENLPSAHQVAKENDLSRYYSVLELPRSQQNHVTFSTEPPKDNRYFYGKTPVVNFPSVYLVRNKQQTYKAPPMEVPYENPNCQFLYDASGSPKFGNQDGQPNQPNKGNVPPIVNNFPHQFNSRIPLTSPNAQSMKSAYSVYTPGNLNSQSLNNVYVPPMTVYPLRNKTARGVYSGNEGGRVINQPQLSNLPPVERHYAGNNVGGTNENPKYIRNFPTRWKESLPNEPNCPCNNCPKTNFEIKPNDSPAKVFHCTNSNCQSPQNRQGPYEGNDLPMKESQSKWPANDRSSEKKVPNSETLSENLNHSSIPIDHVKRLFEILKVTLETQPLTKQNAEVQNNLPEISREDKTTHTQYKVENKETQYKPNAIEFSQDFKEIGTQVKYVDHTQHMRKCQGVTALHSHFRNKSPNDWKHASGNSKYYIDLGEANNDSNLEKKNNAYQEIADIIKRENGKNNQEMTDVIFNMIYGKNCHIVVQKGAANEEGKKNSLQKNIKKNQGISTTNFGLKAQRSNWRDLRASTPLREKNKAKEQLRSPLPTVIEHEVFPKNSLHTIYESMKENKPIHFENCNGNSGATRTGINKDVDNYIRKHSELHDSPIENVASSHSFDNDCSGLLNKTCNKKNVKVKFVEPTFTNVANENTSGEKDEYLVDLQNEKIIECILNNDNQPKGEIVIDVGCVQLPDNPKKSITEQHIKTKENLKVEESGNLSEYVSRTDLYEEAILNLIAKQIKKYSSECKFDVKSEESNTVGENKRGSPISQITSKNYSKLNLIDSISEKKLMITTPLQSEINSIFSGLNIKHPEENSNCRELTDRRSGNELNTHGDKEMHEFYENIKFLFGMLDDGEKYEFISDIMKKISKFYARESKISTLQSPKVHSLVMNDNDNKQGMANEEENALAQILRMICYENDMVNVESLLPQQLANAKKTEVGERTDSSSSDEPSNEDFSFRDEIMSNYVLLDTPDMVINMGNRFVNKLKNKSQAQPETKTVSRGVSANL